MMSPERLDRTIDFILRSQARAEARHEKAEAWQEKAEARHEKAEARHEKAEARQDKLDRRVDSLAKIVQQGIRMLVKVEAGQKRTDKALAGLAAQQKQTQADTARSFAEVARALAELADAQKATEQSLRAFINSRRGSRNGH